MLTEMISYSERLVVELFFSWTTLTNRVASGEIAVEANRSEGTTTPDPELVIIYDPYKFDDSSTLNYASIRSVVTYKLVISLFNITLFPPSMTTPMASTSSFAVLGAVLSTVPTIVSNSSAVSSSFCTIVVKSDMTAVVDTLLSVD